MAKKETQKSEMVKVDSNLPTFIPQGDVSGTEHITKDDLQMPRLSLAQALSPQLDELNPKYIPDLKKGQMFNNLTGEVYEVETLEFIVVRADKPRGIEFAPMDEGGGIVDMDVPLNDPRMQFSGSDKPIATKFYDYIIMLLPSTEVVALSLKGTGIKVAKQLNGLIKLRRAPLFAGKYQLAVANQRKGEFNYYIFVIKNAGIVQEEETYLYAKGIFESIKDKQFDIEREAGDDSEAPPIDVDAKDVPF